MALTNRVDFRYSNTIIALLIGTRCAALPAPFCSRCGGLPCDEGNMQRLHSTSRERPAGERPLWKRLRLTPEHKHLSGRCLTSIRVVPRKLFGDPVFSVNIQSVGCAAIEWVLTQSGDCAAFVSCHMQGGGGFLFPCALRKG